MSHADHPPARAPFGTAFERRLRLARLAILWERVVPAFGPAVAVVGVFLALALFDLPAQLPGFLHAGLLAVMAALLVAALIIGVGRLRLPDRSDARRRIETVSGLAHRPLAALEDNLAGGATDPTSEALWRVHRARMAEVVRRLRVGTPKAGLTRRDPYALRALLTLAFAFGVLDAGGDWADRIGRSLSPNFSASADEVPVALDIWLTPPDYTGLPPQFLKVGEAGATAIPVPVGSTLLAQVHGGGGVPELLLDDKSAGFQRIDDSNFKGSAKITAGKRIAVVQEGRTLGSWPITVIPDLPPTIAFAKPPTHTDRGVLRLEYKATDDYGVEGAKAIMRLKGDKSGAQLVIDLPLPGQHLKDASAASYHDLTPHPWAGLPVEMKLQAVDAIGQTGTSETIETVLPERVFHNPVAKAIIDARKELTLHPDDRQPVAETLSDLSERPSFFNNDDVVFLALRTAQARLVLNHDPDTISAVQELLWETALRIEDGRASTMQRDLRQAMQALQDALARNAPDAEIQRLMNQLQQAIDQYLQALAQQMQHMPPQQMQPIDPSQMVTRQDLQRMLDRARDLARTGAKDQARDLLSQLQEMLENLRMGQAGQMSSGQSQAMRQMQQMMQRQQQLLDRSFRNSQQGNQQGDQSQGDANDQEALRQMLGDMMQQLGDQGGDVPAPLARADRAMRNAVQALRQAQPGDAIGPQTEALDALQQAARAMQQQMAGRGMGARPGGGTDPGDEGVGEGQRDPFGRFTDENGNGGYDDGGLMRMGKGPNDYALEKAKQILDELRQRAGERDRPEIERDYIDRLLKQF
ncbi:MAG TPA: TIGR02302 family protein [Stellaceae bacterium]|nr:TIGR02302 family protein [Stellaceae bacterium]